MTAISGVGIALTVVFLVILWKKGLRKPGVDVTKKLIQNREKDIIMSNNSTVLTNISDLRNM